MAFLEQTKGPSILMCLLCLAYVQSRGVGKKMRKKPSMYWKASMYSVSIQIYMTQGSLERVVALYLIALDGFSLIYFF